MKKVSYLSAVALGTMGLHASPAMASNCDMQYFDDYAACEGDTTCQDNAAAVYVICLESESDVAPCGSPAECRNDDP